MVRAVVASGIIDAKHGVVKEWVSMVNFGILQAEGESAS